MLRAQQALNCPLNVLSIFPACKLFSLPQMPFSPTACPWNELHLSITDSLNDTSRLWTPHCILLVRINCFPPLHLIGASILELTTLNYNNLFYGCLCPFPRLVNSNSDCIAKSWGEHLLNQFSGMKPRWQPFALLGLALENCCFDYGVL